MRKFLLILVLLSAFSLQVFSQEPQPGIIAGNIIDEKGKAVRDATIELRLQSDTLKKHSAISDKDGGFSFTELPFGLYRLRISFVGLKPMVIDSIHVRAERFDFSLNDISLKQPSDEQLEEVVVYAEKPLIQSKDGNITFNAAETPLSAGASANELLRNVPLVTTDANGKVLLKGKEPRILVDDKPVELNQQQLQDLLESMSGSMIERIEVMTNPPPQYANEQGGVINIVTRKGKVGISGRLSLSGGTRGETSINGQISYRKQGLAIMFTTGAALNKFQSEGYSRRENVYADSTNHFNTISSSNNRNVRPNARLNIDYEFDKRNNLNFTLQFNQSLFNNRSSNEYTNINRFGDIYRLSQRFIRSEGQNVNPNLNLTYTRKGKKPGEVFRFIGILNYGYSQNDRYFFQEFLHSDHTPTGKDSTQEQLNDTWNNGFVLRTSYDKMLGNKKTYLSTGAVYNYTTSHVLLNSSFLQKPGDSMVKSELLSNDFRFKQSVTNLRFSVKQIFSEGFSATAGINAEQTQVEFDLYKIKDGVFNNYWSWLPFANVNRTWKDKLNMSLAYRRTIRRPGIWEMNPSIDYGDPYNLRFGNPYLKPSMAHTFDFVVGKTKPKFYVNLGLGYNIIEDIYSQLRTLLPEGKTQITYQNINDRKEYEVSAWSGYTISRKLRINFSSSYTYNEYGLRERTVNRFRNGGSFHSNLNSTFTPQDIWNFTSSFTFNRFANPQGSVRSNLSMNLGIQRKWFNKQLITTINFIDPFIQQKNRSFTYAPNFNLETYNSTQTRNIRFTVAYIFNNTPKKKTVPKKTQPVKPAPKNNQKV
ncbi:MAG TPA: outer membrane beta-barrel protein [Chitinophagaceae bacterium]